MTRLHCLHPDACTAAKPTTHCRSCALANLNSDPAIAAKRNAAILARAADPVKRAVMVKTVAANNARARAEKPEFDAWIRERGRHLRLTVLGTPEVKAKLHASRERRGKARTETIMGWCPPAYRDMYRRLTRSHKSNAEIARAAVLAKIEADNRARLSPFEAADYLRKYAPVMRCDEAGKLSSIGSHFRYGTVVRTRDDVVRIALDRGWVPFQLKVA